MVVLSTFYELNGIWKLNMSIKSVEINNILSFDNFKIDSFKDINCIVGANNVGKSNLLRCFEFFYLSLNDDQSSPSPSLRSNYSYCGHISITFDVTRLLDIARGGKDENNYFKFLLKTLLSHAFYSNTRRFIKLTVKVFSDNRVSWNINDYDLKRIISDNYPFFFVETRHIDLHRWDSIWDVISSIKPFKLSNIERNDVIDFFDSSLGNQGSYRNHINQLQKILKTKQHSPKEKYLTYIKSGLIGENFSIDDNDLKKQSDGTNSFHYLTRLLKTIIEISSREYINPIVFVDEPENGLHPKMSEEMVYEIFKSYGPKATTCRKRSTLFIATHSPNILKETIKNFKKNQSIYLFNKNSGKTIPHKLNSNSESESFTNRFNDNEARLFFSKFILFVEGETEIEVFSNQELKRHFPSLNKIDLYKYSDNIAGNNVNPFKTKSSTPYLFLYDADKVIEYRKSKNNPKKLELELRNEVSTIDKLNIEYLKEELKRYNMGFSNDRKIIAHNIKFLIECFERDYKFDKLRQRSELNHKYLVAVFNNYLETKNTRLNRTTFEECLVNSKSLPLFLKWLPSKIEKSQENIKKYLTSKNRNDELASIYIRTYINGKTDILTNTKKFNSNKTNEKISQRSLTLYRTVDKKLFYGYNDLFKKGSGWATDFLNFSIKEIEIKANSQSKSFKEIFQLYFSEINDILIRLRPDR